MRGSKLGQPTNRPSVHKQYRLLNNIWLVVLKQYVKNICFCLELFFFNQTSWFFCFNSVLGWHLPIVYERLP